MRKIKYISLNSFYKKLGDCLSFYRILKKLLFFHRRHVLNKYFKIGTKSSQSPIFGTYSERTSMIKSAVNEAFIKIKQINYIIIF